MRLADLAASLGLPVFPCGASKRPAFSTTNGGNGFHDATINGAEIERLFAHPGARLIGVPTGPLSGIDVLDDDPRNGGGDWISKNAFRIPRTRTHATRSGGRHFVFRSDPGVRNSESRIARGIDIRGTGGFVIWWPAHGCKVLDHAPPAPWPEWLLPLVLPPAPLQPAPCSAARLPYEANAAQRMVERLIGRLETAGAGERHHRLRATSCTIGGLLDAAGLTQSAVERDLLDAVIKAGGSNVDRRNAAATIAWGLNKGASTPLDASAQSPRPPDPRRKRLARLTFRSLRAGMAPLDLLDQLHHGNRLLDAPLAPAELDRLLIWCVQCHQERSDAR